MADEATAVAVLKAASFWRHAIAHASFHYAARRVLSEQRVSMLAASQQQLTEAVQRLKDASARRVLWRLQDLKDRIRELADVHSIAPNDTAELQNQLDRLHGILRDAGIECLPAPQIDRNLDATIDIVWFDRRNRSSLGLTVLPEGEPEGRIWMHMLEDDSAHDWFDPTDAQVIAATKRFARI